MGIEASDIENYMLIGIVNSNSCNNEKYALNSVNNEK